ncbi:DUF2304 domain-containing protein [Schaalia sp. Marseille-Q2122]|uniref:DUF2304 domain-containing protein n=1 Tax=Schaalia sp. Marseille-Q2122 TaxID=2736604 RepID=UPI00158C2FC2|nr:DUF2304 domain-containing protein [Schaalia sp. Marseille-Q2122]
MTSYFLGILFSLLVFVVIFMSLRNARMKQRYATWWVAIAFAVLTVSIFPDAMANFARSIGIIIPLNLAFFLAGLTLLFITLQYSVDLSHLSEDKRRLVEEIAELDRRVCELEKRNSPQ